MSAQTQGPTAPRSKARAIGAAAAVAATGALACGVCCVLPFALPAAVMATAGGALAWFGGLHRWVAIVAILAVVAGWAWVGLDGLRARRRPARSTLIVLAIATLMLAAAIAWPLLAALVLRR